MSNVLVGNGAERYEEVAANLEHIESQLRGLCSDMRGLTDVMLSQSSHTGSFTVPRSSLESRYVTRDEYNTGVKDLTTKMNSLSRGLQDLQLQVNKFDLLNGDSLDAVRQRLEYAQLLRERSGTHSLKPTGVKSETSGSCQSKPATKAIETFRGVIANHNYSSQAEKENALRLVDDQLRWLGGRKTEFIADMVDDVNDTLTRDFMADHFLVEKYKEYLPALAEAVMPCTPLPSTDISDAEYDEDETNNKVAEPKLKCAKSEMEGTDFDRADGDDSMIM